jgi:hypothetical protein
MIFRKPASPASARAGFPDHALLAQSPRHEIFRLAVVPGPRLAGQEHHRRAFLGRISVEAFAFPDPCLVELIGARLAVRRTVAATTQAARPVTIAEGVVMFDRVSLGLFTDGSNNLDLSNSLHISLIRPGFSRSGAGCGGSMG